MRIVLVMLAAALVFGLMLLFDTTALIQLTLYCVTGGCGVPPLWIACAAVVLVAAAVILRRRRPVKTKAKSGKKPTSLWI